MRVFRSSRRIRVELNLSGVLRDIGALDPVRVLHTYAHLNWQSIMFAKSNFRKNSAPLRP